MADADMQYFYVALYGKPRHPQSEGDLQFDAGVNLFLYEGPFTTETVASIVTPLANGEAVSFPEELRGLTHGYHWRGTAARI